MSIANVVVGLRGSLIILPAVGSESMAQEAEESTAGERRKMLCR
jgi:hypothetical protein